MFRMGCNLPRFLLLPVATLALLACSVAWGAETDSPPPKSEARVVEAVSPELRMSLRLDPFCEKHLDAGGLPILSSGKVSDAAMLEASFLIDQMLAKRDDLRAAMHKRNVRIVVMAPTEMTTDVPEQRNMNPKEYWDQRARGLGGRITSCGEENLLNLRGDRYRNENILIHEFGHAIHSFGLREVDRKFDERLRATYRLAVAEGRWKDTYAATNHGEYWAEGVQSYFDCNAPPGGVHNDVGTREKLQEHDPALFALIDEVFRQVEWCYQRFDQRQKK